MKFDRPRDKDYLPGDVASFPDLPHRPLRTLVVVAVAGALALGLAHLGIGVSESDRSSADTMSDSIVATDMAAEHDQDANSD